MLVAPGPPPLAAHIPFVLHRADGQLGTLVAHTARADPIHAALDGSDELLAVFTGAAAYLRSRWYHEPGLPTYNFVAVHAHGRPRPISERDAVLAHLSELVDAHERDAPDAFRLAEAPADYVAPLLEHIACERHGAPSLRPRRRAATARSIACGHHTGMLGGMSAAPATGVDATRRTRLANERTFLAWWRTALATEGLALAAGKVVPEVIDGPQWPYVVLGLLLSVLGTALALCGWWRHATVDRALHGGEEAAPPGWLIAALGTALGVAGAFIAVLILAA